MLIIGKIFDKIIDNIFFINFLTGSFL